MQFDRQQGSGSDVQEDYHQLEWSDDGQPFSPRFGDHFYSREDGRAESVHVFIEGNGLPQRWDGVKQFTIGELGFGTGLNFLETWRQWQNVRGGKGILNFVSVEAYPLGGDQMAKAHLAWPDLEHLSKRVLGKWAEARQRLIAIDDQTNLRVVEATVEAALDQFPENVDAWYLDGFSPALNRDMWSAEVMGKVAKHSASGTTLSSYTSAGWVRRNLIDAGFSVKKRPGFGRKREMIVGTLGTAS